MRKKLAFKLLKLATRLLGPPFYGAEAWSDSYETHTSRKVHYRLVMSYNKQMLHW